MVLSKLMTYRSILGARCFSNDLGTSLRRDIIAVLNGMEKNAEETMTGEKEAFLRHLEIKISGSNHKLLDAFAAFCIYAGKAMGGKVPGPRSLPLHIRKWSVLSSPFAHKTAWTQFERRTHSKVVSICNFPSTEQQKQYIWYIERNMPPDISFECAIHEYMTLEGFLCKKFNDETPKTLMPAITREELDES